MKKIPTLLAAAACIIFPSCKKEKFILPDEAFSVLQVDSVGANNGWFEVVPANNDFYYTALVFQKDIYNLYGESIIDTIDNLTRKIYEIMIEGETNPPSFEEACLDNGAYLEPLFDLTGGTGYIAIGYPYEKSGVPRHRITSYEFTTLPQPVSSNTFDISMEGSEVTLSTSNGDPYFCYSERKEIIDKNFDGRPGYFFRETIDYFWEYGFLSPEYLNHGGMEEDLAYYYDLKPGDKIYYMVAGYDRGLSTETSIFLITYNGPGRTGTVEKANKVASTLNIKEIEDGIQRTIKRRIQQSAKPDPVRR